MTTIELTPNVKMDIEEVLTGVSKMDTPDLERFVEQVLFLRAKRIAPSLPGKEAELLAKISRSLPTQVSKRMAFLNSIRQDGLLSEEELTEFRDLAVQIEQLNLERVQCLEQLAELREMPVRKLMEQLGIHPKPYA